MSRDDVSGIATPRQLCAALQNRSVAMLLPQLGPDAERRISTGDLTVSEIVVAAQWLGISPPFEVFRGYPSVLN